MFVDVDLKYSSSSDILLNLIKSYRCSLNIENPTIRIHIRAIRFTIETISTWSKECLKYDGSLLSTPF